jgi:iron-sulfur cluster repair protein YtfE (RIC family)
MSLDNSKIRKIVLVEHEGLRGSMRSIEALLPLVSAGEKEALVTAQSQLKDLLNTFVRHIEHEERILRPVLEVIDAWGEVRRARMDQEHSEQRPLVMRLAAIDPSPDPQTWAREVDEFIKMLRVDMADEEKTCLSPNVLRDDVVVVDGSSE